MESYLLQWPTEDMWKISHASVQEGGKGVVLEFRRAQREGMSEDHASMTSLSGTFSMPLQEMVDHQVKIQRESRPEISHFILNKSADNSPYPWITYVLEGLQDGSKVRSSIHHIVKGDKGLYLLVMIHHEAYMPMELREKWSRFFQSGKIVPQSLSRTLAQSNLIGGTLPESLTLSQEEETEQNPDEEGKSLPDPRIVQQSHPQHPGDIQVWTLASAQQARPLHKVWARVLTQQEEVWQALVIQEAEGISSLKKQDVIYLMWSEARQDFFQVTPLFLAEHKEWQITPCQPCGFELLMQAPSELMVDGSLAAEVSCVCCGGKQRVQHLRYVPPLTLEEEEDLPSWWEVFIRWVRSFPFSRAQT